MLNSLGHFAFSGWDCGGCAFAFWSLRKKANAQRSWAAFVFFGVYGEKTNADQQGRK